MSDPQPAAYAAILRDEEEDPEDGGVVVEDEMSFHEIEGVAVYEGDDGYLYYNENEAEEVFAAAQYSDSSADTDGEDEDNAGRRPILMSTPDTIPRFHIVAEDGGIGRGERGARGGRGARRERRRVARRGRASGGWTRGEPWVERFVSDEDLPEQLRVSIGRFLADQNRRERSSRERSAVRARLNEGMNEEEEEEEEEEVFEDAEDFVWQPMDGWRGVKETFLRDDSGPTSVFTSAYECFRAYWDDNILSHIVEETNKHALGIQSDRFHQVWYATNLDEIMILFAFWMMLGVIKMPSIRSCYSKMPILHTGVFRYLLPERRYWDLNRSFHLATDSDNVNDPLHPISPVLNHLNTMFQQLYKLQQDICIDESLTLWKDPLGFKQCIRTKVARFGIKTFQICESGTGYLWNFCVYVGRSTLPSSLPLSLTHIKTLIQPLLNLGHTVYMDNWFNSPTLARYLKRRRTDCVGIFRPDQKHVPPVIRKAELNPGEFIARQAGDMMVMSLQDRKRVHLLSTYHDTAQVKVQTRPGRPSQYRHQLVEDYNKCMGGLDRTDQTLEPYLVGRKECVKWTKKLFKRLLNISIQNARILLEKSSDSKIEPLAFRLALVEAIITRHHHNLPHADPTPSRARLNTRFPLERLSGRHFIRRTPITDEILQKVRHRENMGRRRCVWCTSKGACRKTIYECPDCDNVALCLDPCFKEYHTIRE